jgi:hypothetical protein
MEKEGAITIAKGSWGLTIVAIVLNVASRQLDAQTRFYVAVGGMCLYGAGLLAGLLALGLIFRFGRRGILVHALIGTIANSFLVCVMALAIAIGLAAKRRALAGAAPAASAAPQAAAPQTPAPETPPMPVAHAMPVPRQDPAMTPSVPPRPFPSGPSSPMANRQPPGAPPFPRGMSGRRGPGPLSAEDRAAATARAAAMRATATRAAAHPHFLLTASNPPGQSSGEKIETLWGTQWVAATIYRRESDGAYILYDGRGSSAAEWADNAKLRKPSIAPTLAALVVGQKVEAFRSHAFWEAATVVKKDASRVFVHYDKSNDIFNEWLAPNEIRIPR